MKLKQKEIKKLLFDKFGFTNIDVKYNNWRAKRLIEVAKIISERIK